MGLFFVIRMLFLMCMLMLCSFVGMVRLLIWK